MSSHNTALRHEVPAFQSLDDAWTHVCADPRFPKHAQQRLRSSIQLICHLLGRSARDVSIESGSLQKELLSIRWESLGISRDARNRAVSSLRRAQVRLGLRPMARRSQWRLTAAWSDLLAQVEGTGRRYDLRVALELFSDWGIDPANVDHECFSRFNDSLENVLPWRRARRTYRQAVGAWNFAFSNVPDWPRVSVTVQRLRSHHMKKWSDFPESLLDDVKALSASSLQRSEGKRIMPRLRPATVASKERVIRKLASAIVEAGVPPTELTSIAHIVQPARVERALRLLSKRDPSTRGKYIYRISCEACLLARWWVDLEKEQYQRLCDIRRALLPSKLTRWESRSNILRSFDDDSFVRRLVSLPSVIEKEVGGAAVINRGHSLRLQVALSIEMLIVAPLKLANLTRIHLSRNLINFDRGARRGCGLQFSGCEMGNGLPFTLQLPLRTFRMIQLYVYHARPRLLSCPNEWLFPGRGSGHRSTESISSRIGEFTNSLLGVRVTPTDFRFLAAYIYLKRNPDSIEVVRRLLGHRNLESTISLYRTMQQAIAAQRFDRYLSGTDGESSYLRERTLDAVTGDMAAAIWRESPR